MKNKKKLVVLLAMVALLASLTGCARHCKECDNEVYKDGYCEYHYGLNQLMEMFQ